MIFLRLIGICFLMSCVLFSCGDNQKKTTKKPDIGSKEFQNRLIEANKMYVKRESDEIDQYARHKNWDMITTGTGLRYMITKNGSGEPAVQDEKFDTYAKVNYKVYLLDGTLCYSSDSLGAYEFLIGHDHVERGLHEGIQYLHVGDKAIFILPSHLAHGLIGDQGKIPAKSSVRYDLELLSIRKVPKNTQ